MKQLAMRCCMLAAGIVGIREGTLVAACTTGFIVNAVVKTLGGAKPAIDIKK